jgi:hypothetical protein
MLPLCFVLMPFGKKAIPSGATVDFDAVYHDLIAPAIEAAGMEALRADQEVSGGVIHKPMYERLILCDFAVADLTGANANVFYELGLRHGVRPATTVLLYAGSDACRLTSRLCVPCPTSWARTASRPMSRAHARPCPSCSKPPGLRAETRVPTVRFSSCSRATPRRISPA